MLNRVVIIVSFFLYFICYGICNKVLKCSDSYCNNVGICVGNSTRVCQCMPQYYTGEHCTTQISQCKKFPCKNNGMCISVPGNHVCICNGKFGGPECNHKSTYAIGLHLIVHYMVDFGECYKFVLVSKTLGTEPLGVTITSKKYLLKILRWNYIVEGQTTIEWRYTGRLKNVLRNLGIRDLRQQPFIAGYYQAINACFWEEGEQTISVNLRKLSDGSTISTRLHSIIVRSPKVCKPHLELNSCAYPDSPMRFAFSRFANIFPRIRKRCNDNQITGHWKLYNGDGSKFLHDYGKNSSLLLKMPQYTMWFNESCPHTISKHNFYMLLLNAFDGVTDVIFRCYVQFVSVGVEAIINGGIEKIYDYNTQITLNGTRSRDFNLNPLKKQSLTYEWNCTSEDDPQNILCSKFPLKYKSKSWFQFASSHLGTNKKYTFTLKVRSLINSNQYDTTQQIISIEEDVGSVIVDIECVRNCALRSYTPEDFVHLKAICIGCSSDVQYEWKKSSMFLSNQQRLIVHLTEKNETITVQITTNRGIGIASINLSRVEGTINQKCTLLKNTGFECFTALHIHCSGINDDNIYNYHYSIANVTFMVYNPTTTLYLPYNVPLEVAICNQHRNCVTQKLHLDLTPIKIPTTLAGMKKFINNKNTNIRMMLANNNIEPALCIAHRLAKHATSLEEAILIYDQYKDFDFPRLIDTDRIFLITTALLAALEPIDYQDAEFFGKQIGLIFRSLNNIVRDMEILDMSYSSYAYLSKMLVMTFNTFCIETEEMARDLLYYENEDAYIAATVNWPDFDSTVTIRMIAWLKLFSVLNKCTQEVGKISTHFHYPKEPPFIIRTDNAELKVEADEDLNEDIHETSDYSNVIRLPKKFIIMARKKLGRNEILVQSIQFLVNPAWWYPSHWVPTSNCFSYNLFSNFKYLGETNIPIHITSNNTQYRRRPIFIRDTLISNSKISIFRTSVPPYGQLLVHFTRATAELLVLLQLHRTPTLYQVWNEPTCKVTRRRTLVLTSRCPETNVAYLAVLAPHEFDADHKPMYQFYMMIRQCAHWDYQNYGWENSKCTPIFNPKRRSKLVCECSHLSTFAARQEPVHATALRVGVTIKDELDINWTCVYVFGIFFSLLFILTWMSWSNIGHHNVIHVISREEAHSIDYKTERTLIHLRTGGFPNASSTASIILDFVSQRTGHCRIVIFQDPKRPQLIENSNCMTRINSNKLQLPAELTIRHDDNGDYPNWYCREIEVNDLKNNLTCVYAVRTWIQKNKRYSVSPSANISQQSEVRGTEASSTQHHRRIFVSFYQWRNRYVKSIAHSYINWFFVQPVLGPWRYDGHSMNGFERTCIWVSKLVVSICIVCAYFGRTTKYNYYDYIEISSAVNLLNVLMICLICYIAGLVVDYFFHAMLD